ncbi:EF-hand domain-containing protein [Anabaena minutissima FACHB-250]|nr:EF-hand domain-containing protein [Anabaena minutissima FACHB-250]
MALTELQKRKLKKVFDLYDVDGSGVITAADYEQMARSQAEVQGYKPGSLEYNIIRSQFRTLWNNLQKEVDFDNNGKITLEEFLEHKEKQLNFKESYRPLWLERSSGGLQTAQSYERSPAENAIAKLSNLIFERLDVDGNGDISREEYKQGFMTHTSDSNLSDEIFTKLDLNGDRHLTKEEVLQHIHDFFYSDDPEAPGNWILGPY